MISKPKNIVLLKAIKEVDKYKKTFDVPPQVIDDVKKDLKIKIGQSDEVIQKRLAGLSNEDEFHFVSFILGNIVQITKLNQDNSNENYQTPDFLVAVRAPEKLVGKKGLCQRFFAEVKKLPDGALELSITKKYYQKLRNYCDLYSLPLFFAVNMSAPNQHFSKWFLIPGKAVEQGRFGKGKVHGSSMKDCYILDFNGLIKNDYFSLWLGNHLIYMLKGFSIKKAYEKNGSAPIREENFGSLVEMGCSYQNLCKDVKFKDGLDARDLAYFVVLKHMAVGKETKTKKNGVIEVIYTADSNYMRQFYKVVMDSYLDLRDRMKAVTGENFDIDVGYLLENFRPLDVNMVLMIKDVIFEIEKLGIVMAVKDLPTDLYDEILK